MKEHLELLGFKVKDVVTGLTGVVTSVSFDLSGCIQALVSPGLNEKGDVIDGHWYDTKRLERVTDAPVMQQPVFEVIPGGQEMPAFPSKPTR